MRESVLLQVGQCGNQVGFNFWKTLIQEYNKNSNLIENDYLQFLKPKSGKILEFSKSLEESYSARGLLIDMEEGVINAGRKSSMGSLFLPNQIITDVSGSGNNWAEGYLTYGQKYAAVLENAFRVQTESCDSIDSFLLLFSLSGGTGSGLGTYALEMLKDIYPKVWRLSFVVYPSETNDVITSPYNAALCNSKLIDGSDVIIPFENCAIDNIIRKLESNKFLKKMISSSPNVGSPDLAPFDRKNNFIATAILDFTCSARYSSESSRSLREISMNLSPDPYMKYALPSISPLFPSDDYSVSRLFNETYTWNSCLFHCTSDKPLVNSVTVVARGVKMNSTVVQNHVNRLDRYADFTGCVNQSVQTATCKRSNSENNASVVMLSNSNAVLPKLQQMKLFLGKLYKRKAYLKHYENADPDISAKIDAAHEKLEASIQTYESLSRLVIED